MAFPKSSDGRFGYGAFLEVVSPERMRTMGWIDVDYAFDLEDHYGR